MNKKRGGALEMSKRLNESNLSKIKISFLIYLCLFLTKFSPPNTLNYTEMLPIALSGWYINVWEIWAENECQVNISQVKLTQLKCAAHWTSSVNTFGKCILSQNFPFPPNSIIHKCWFQKCCRIHTFRYNVWYILTFTFCFCSLSQHSL